MIILEDKFEYYIHDNLSSYFKFDQKFKEGLILEIEKLYTSPSYRYITMVKGKFETLKKITNFEMIEYGGYVFKISTYLIKYCTTRTAPPQFKGGLVFERDVDMYPEISFMYVNYVN